MILLQKLDIVLRPELKIQNIVCTADLKQKIDIASFNKYEFLSSNLDLYNCGYVKDDSMIGRTTVFRTGKLISVGTKSQEQSYSELRKSCKILQNHNLAKPIKIIPQVRNMVARFDFGEKLPILKLARILPRCMYEPEQFPGLIFHIENSCTALIFASGKIILAGAKSIEELNSSLFELESLISTL